MSPILPIDRILALLGASKPGNCRCPAHDDSTPSLSVTSNADDAVGIYCQAGCTTEAVMSALGLPMSALYPSRDVRDSTTTKPRIVATYDYVDEDGRPLYQVVRFEPKGFRQRHLDKDRWIWNLKGCRRVLYRLPQIIAAIERDDVIYLAEGEKDVHALEQVGVVATTNAMGAGKWHDDYSAILAGGRVVVVADNDEPGRRHAARVACSLRDANCLVSVVQPMAGFKDAAEMLGAGKGTQDWVVWPEDNVARRAIGPLLENYWGGDDFLDREESELAPWAVDNLVRINWRVVIVGAEGQGKALDVDTPLLTDSGWSTMGDVQIGDRVWHPSGRLIKVVAASETMVGRSCLKVRFDDGTTIVADADHLWRTAALTPGGARVETISTTRAMAATLDVRDGHCRNHAIPVTSPLDGLNQALPIDPYVLGAWLGDGTSRSGQIACADKEIVDHIRAAGYTVEKLRGRYQWSISRSGDVDAKLVEAGHLVEAGSSIRRAERTVGLGRGSLAYRQTTGRSRRSGVNGLTVELRAAGILSDKHIPSVYQQAPFSDRLALLQGLMDTDGTVDRASRCEFSVCNERLARDVETLLLGLGIKVVLSSGPATLNGRRCGTRWRLAFQTELPVFRLARKACRLSPWTTRRAGLRYVVAVEPIESTPVRCIQVDAEDGMFLVSRRLVPTHNSVVLRQLAICASQGVHPFRFQEMTPIRTMLVDLENSDDAIAFTGRRIRDHARLQARPGVPRNNWHLWTEPAGLDLRHKRDQDRFAERLELHRPQLVCIGPAYQLFPATADNDRDAVGTIIRFFNAMRTTYGFGLVIEHHAPKGDSRGVRVLDPFGSQLWRAWPDLGLKLCPVTDVNGQPANAETTEVQVFRVGQYRGSRLPHGWPNELHRGTVYPWEGKWGGTLNDR